MDWNFSISGLFQWRVGGRRGAPRYSVEIIFHIPYHSQKCTQSTPSVKAIKIQYVKMFDLKFNMASIYLANSCDKCCHHPGQALALALASASALASENGLQACLTHSFPSIPFQSLTHSFETSHANPRINCWLSNILPRKLNSTHSRSLCQPVSWS